MGVLEVDQAIGSTGGPLLILFGGTAEDARSVLLAIAQSMLTFTGLVFTVTGGRSAGGADPA